MKSDFYFVTATVTHTQNLGQTPNGETITGYHKTVQIPAFILDSRIQGIVSAEHAERIVNDMLNPFKDPNINVSASVVEAETVQRKEDTNV